MKKIYCILSLALALVLCNSCSYDKAADSISPTGKGGSMARFAINGNYLYTVDSKDLRIFDISTPATPVYRNKKQLGFDIETIFPYDKYLFIGTQTGMQIVSVQDPVVPEVYSTYSHVRSCDPVVAQDTVAYVTLRAGRTCGNAAVNQLEVLNVKNLRDPYIVNAYPLTGPYGLGIDGNRLFVCDGTDGLKVFKMNTPTNLSQIAHYPMKDAYDVIPLNNLLIISAGDGIYQCSYSQSNYQINLLSKMSVER